MVGMHFPHWVEKRGKGNLKKFTRDFRAKFDQYVGVCSFVTSEQGEICGRPVYDRRHVISRASVLNKLKHPKSGKVLEMEWHVAEWQRLYLRSDEAHPVDLADPATFAPRPVGTHEACTRPLACEIHDPEYYLLDAVNPDFGDPRVRLQTCHRTVLCGLDLRRHERRLLSTWRPIGMRNTTPSQRVVWHKLVEENETARRMAENASRFFGRAWYSNQSEGRVSSGLIGWEALGFRSKLNFAACILSRNGVIAVVFPDHGDSHKMVMLYLAEMAGSVEADYERLTRAAAKSQVDNDYGVDVIQAIMGNGSGMMAASPKSYSTLCERDRLKVNQSLYDSVGIGPLLNDLPFPTGRGGRGSRPKR